ncbi:hypothetical protein L7F22_012137 [Adiantum nelumboides]|nr:hypothetical protein [Adiantum nelumboides]
MIPPAPHFVYYSPSSRHGANQSFFTGFFIHHNAGDVIVRRWDPHFETLVKLSDPDEEERYQASVRNFDLDRHLGAYDLHHYHTWKRLTSHINPQVIERIEPVASNICVMHEADYADKLPQTAAERYMNQHLAEQREVLSNEQAAIEAQAMARTADDDMVLDKAGNGDTLIDKSWFSDDNFLRARFKEFYQLVMEAQPVDGDLLKQTRRLKRLLETSIGWSFGDVSNGGDDDEYASVIVPESELSGYC